MENNELQGFRSSKRFFDSVNFPYGFARSGDFTRSQAATLEKLGEALKALAEGSQEPQTDEEARFIQVCKGEIPASNAPERAWLAYTQALERKNRSLRNYHGSSKGSESSAAQGNLTQGADNE